VKKRNRFSSVLIPTRQQRLLHQFGAVSGRHQRRSGFQAVIVKPDDFDGHILFLTRSEAHNSSAYQM
jgi:hypothetical protein